jgi:predicted  nucleic acid-binding Zn-ribbon protein
MPTTLEERVAYLEGKVEEHSKAWQDLKDLIIHLDGRVLSLEQRINHLEQKFDQRFVQIDQRFVQIDQRFIQIDQRFMQIDQRFIQIDRRIDKLFFFILATLASSIGSLIAAIISIVAR